MSNGGKIYKDSAGHERRIVTTHEYPPIPLRGFDWCAYLDGDEELQRYGYGPSEDDAITDLLDLLETFGDAS